jgi:aconitate hydratase
VRANYLASPPLVVAYAIAGTVDIDLTTEPLGTGATAAGVPEGHLADAAEVADTIERVVGADLFREQLRVGVRGRRGWRKLPRCPKGDLYAWDRAPRRT